MNATVPSTPQQRLSGARVFFVLGGLGWGGSERQVSLLAAQLQQRAGVSVHVWGFGDPGGLAQCCDRNGISWRVWPFPRLDRLRGPRRWFGGWKTLRRLAVDLKDSQPDLLLPYTILPNVCCGLIWRKTGARACVWNQRDGGIQRLSGYLERVAVRRVSCCASNSEHGADFLAGQLRVPRQRIHVIPNGVALHAPADGREVWRQRLDLGAADFVACMPSNIHPRKDHATLIHAWSKIRQTGSRRVVLLLAGELGPGSEMLRAQVHELGLDPSVRFLGRVEDMAGLLGTCDLLVFSSRSEGLPNGVLEGMAAGLPVVGTDVPGIREAVGPDGLRWLAPPGDDRVFAERIQSMVGDEALRRSEGEKARARIRECFSVENVYSRTCQLLERLVAR